MATMDLFRLLTTETSQTLGYAYPAAGADQAYALVNALHEEG